jgi:ATP-dependent helicase/nuclease subunit B
MTGIYNIPASRPFADNLVRGILKKYGHDPLELNNIILLLPNRRSCRSVQEAFLRATEGKPSFLPRMQPLGDVGDEDFILKTSLGEVDSQLPCVMSATRQRLLLATLIEKFQGGYIGKNKITLVQSTNLAIDLAALLDEVQRRNLSLERLHDIVPDDLAKHWQITLDFMDIIVKNWPQILADNAMIDAGTHRNITLELLAKHWQKNPPQNIVIAAGSTGSAPATANLLKVIAKMPNGMVVLPGLDQLMDEDSWGHIDETHPQMGLKLLLTHLEAPRVNVQLWNEYSSIGTPPLDPKEKLISQIMLPASSSDKWQNIEYIADDTIKFLSRIDAPTLQDEARVIALIFRQTLEIPGKTAALITNDKNLAARVISIMETWGVQLDNSAGTPLSQVAKCIFMRLVARMVTDDMSPISLLACLKHPITRCKMGAAQFNKKLREIEITALRGLRISGGIEGIRTALKESGKAELTSFLADIEKILQPFSKLMNSKLASFEQIIEAHVNVALELAQTDEISGEEHLWGCDEGEALHEFLEELKEASSQFGDIPPSQYYGIFEALLAGRAYRPKYGSHPRLNILSPMEARMQGFDLCILGGMNEGSWPANVDSGPWMSRPMRKAFGLPLPEMQVGQAAHDFIQALGAPEVILTRSEKIDGTATISSRWLMRLDALLNICGKKHLIKPTTQWLEIGRLISAPDGKVMPCHPPSPAPPEQARPLEFSVTCIKELMCDPYAYYADKILRLKKLDPIDMEPSNREFGKIAHKVIEKFVAAYENIPAIARLDFIIDNWNKMLENNHIPQAMRAFWQPRFQSIAEQLIQKEQLVRLTSKVSGEVQGAYKIILDDGREFKITARADRIEQTKDGAIRIIDYKSSKLQNIAKALLTGILPQMPLEALMANNNGFEGVNQGNVKELEYWILAGKRDKNPAILEESISGMLCGSRNLDYRKNIDELIAITASGVVKLANVFSKGATSYKSCPDPERMPDSNGFEHLARRSEWD